MKSREELERGGGPSASDARGADLLARSVNWKPVIAAVHGYALGMGTSLAFESDLCVAEAGTRFQITETPRGLSTGARIMAVMSFRGLGSFATDVTLTGRYFTAEEAQTAGVVDRVAATGTHMDVARELATRIAKLPPLAARAIVQTRRWTMIDARREAERYASLNKLYLTEDFAEAARAFAEKRPAGPFKGR
jgi:enoyl-CoA hydratase/carnithine racemase